MKTQTQRVIEKLNQDGEVDNFWAISHYILRLGAIMHSLKRNYDLNFQGAFKEGTKNFNYKLIGKLARREI